MSDYTTIAASIEQARADIKVQIDELRERDTALEQSLTWAAIAYGIDTDANGEPIIIEGWDAPIIYKPGTVIAPVDPHAKPERKGGAKATVDYDTIAEWIKAAKAAGTYSQSVLAEHFNVPVTTAKNWITGCKKRGLLDAATKLPKHAFDQQAARDAVAGPPTGPVKPVSIMPLAATPEPKPRDAGYVSVGQVVAAAGDL